VVVNVGWLCRRAQLHAASCQLIRLGMAILVDDFGYRKQIYNAAAPIVSCFGTGPHILEKDLEHDTANNVVNVTNYQFQDCDSDIRDWFHPVAYKN
jgi:hypothetical protein